MDKQLDAQSSTLSHANWRDYVQLTKPGILRSNLFAAFGGFWVASKWEIDWILMIYMLIGTLLVMASSCVFNNVLDYEHDAKMERTRNRALPSGRLPVKHVIIFGLLLGIIGVLVLGFFVHWFASFLGAFGMVFYVVIYTAWLKRTSTLSTFMGSFAGAMPPLIGYCAVTESMDLGAWLLFAILFIWQPPHFWALGVRRMEEYRAASFLILPVVKGIQRTKIQMIPYIVLLLPASILLYVYDYVGIYYLIISVSMNLIWLGLALSGFGAKDDQKWAKRNFMFSIYYLMVTFLVMILNTVKM